MSTIKSDARSLLRSIGIGNFNATMIIQFLFIAPATTDPKSPSIVLLVKHLQAVLDQIGFRTPGRGYIDTSTAQAFETIAGPGWEQRPWADLVQAVTRARDEGVTYRDDPRPPPNYGPSGMQLGFVNLPDVPGGMLTYGIAAIVGWHLLTKRKR